jgi:hypothetical protein
MARPLKKELTKLNELEKDLKNDLFSARPEDEPSEPLRPLAKPLASDAARPIE